MGLKGKVSFRSAAAGGSIYGMRQCSSAPDNVRQAVRIEIEFTHRCRKNDEGKMALTFRGRSACHRQRCVTKMRLPEGPLWGSIYRAKVPRYCARESTRSGRESASSKST